MVIPFTYHTKDGDRVHLVVTAKVIEAEPRTRDYPGMPARIKEVLDIVWDDEPKEVSKTELYDIIAQAEDYLPHLI